MVRFALKRPVTIIVFFISILLFAVVALKELPIDIFPRLHAPTIYVIEQYGGMSASQMEGFFATRMQDQFLYVNGIRNVESRNIQGLCLIKLSFYENTDMAEASAQVALQVNRTMAFFPPGSLPPQVIRFDASSLPVGELVFSSKTRSLNDIFDLALTRVRPLFATIPGMSSAPPFGSNARSVVINITPEKLRMYNLSADAVVEAIVKNNTITPSGNLRLDSTLLVTTINSLESRVEHFGDIPVKSNGRQVVYVRDIARVEDGSDITVDYALVNGKRSVYIPVVKTADASTWDVVQTLRKRLPEMKSLLPEDVRISYEFDQSKFVINAATSLMTEGLLGALLTGCMVLLFLRDWRSSLVVIVTIPVSVLGSLFFLKLCGQTINIMTLSGLALAIGILVDQATVTIENIHQHLEMGKDKKRAVMDACTEISFPLLLILLCILAVFAPAFVMTGVPRAMFLPLSLSIAFAMGVSFFAAQTLVPVISIWLLKPEKFIYHQQGLHAHAGMAMDPAEVREIQVHGQEEASHPEKNNFFQKLKTGLMRVLERGMPARRSIVVFYLVFIGGLAMLCFLVIGKDLLPVTNSGQLQIRIRETDGTRLEKTERDTRSILSLVDSITGNNISISSAYVGLVPSNFGTSNLYIFTSGTHEAVIQVNLDDKFRGTVAELKEKIREGIARRFPLIRISFEPIELTEKIMSQGASTPVEVRIAGKDMKQIESYAGKLLTKMRGIPILRDVQIAQPLNYPTIQISIDRNKLALMGLTIDNVSRSLTDMTSSSRYTNKNLWLDDKTAYTYQTQVEVPEYAMTSMEELKSVPLVEGQMRPVLGDVAGFALEKIPGEYDRSGPRRFVTISASLYQTDLGTASRAVQKAIDELGVPPPGLVPEVRGMSSLLVETLDALQSGLLAAIVVILLLLAASYQSFPLSICVLSTVPAVLLGSLLVLLLTGCTLNLQSYMGIIMSLGVSVANAILIVTNAEALRIQYQDPFRAAIVSAGIRLRPILMTSLAMIAGMIPMASGMGESGDQTAPLGRAVIGGLLFSTLATCCIVPFVYAWIQQKKSFNPVSLLPEEV